MCYTTAIFYHICKTSSAEKHKYLVISSTDRIVLMKRNRGYFQFPKYISLSKITSTSPSSLTFACRLVVSSKISIKRYSFVDCQLSHFNHNFYNNGSTWKTRSFKLYETQLRIFELVWWSSISMERS